MPGINVNQITSMLAKLPDQSLQQYAAMHKDNPYVVSLAVAESNRRKEMRSAGAMQAGAQPQPKVADAAIAEMALPEEQGIGRLPAPNMQGMADGGIVGYAEGGEVERYQVGGGVMGDMPAGFEAGRFVEPQVGSAENLPWIQRQLRVAAEAEAAGSASPQQKAVLRWAQRFGYTPETEQYPAATATRRSDYEPGYYAGKETKLPALPGQPEAAAKADTGTKAPPVKAPAAPSIGTKAVSTGSVSDLGKLYNRILEQQDATDPAAKERGELASEMTEAPKRRLQAFEEDVKKRGDVYKGREERLAQREAGLTKEKDTMAGLALLEAGLTMMGTRGTLGEAVGAGGKAGLRSYGEGLDKLRAAQAKIEESRERLEDLRINRDDLTATQRRQLQGEVDKGATDAKNLMITSIMERDKVSRAQATAIFAATMEAQMNRERIAGQLQVAQINAGAQQALPAEARMAMMLGTGNTDAERLRTGLAELAKFKAKDGGTNIELLKQFVELKKTDPSLTPEGFLSQAGQVMLPTTSKPPPNSVVRTQPGR